MAEGQDGGFSMLREVQDLAEKFKEEDELYISPYAHLEKAAVLQEARYVSNTKSKRSETVSGMETAAMIGKERFLTTALA